MKVHIIQNGTTRMVLSGESEIEKQLLCELFKGPVDVQIMDKLQIVTSTFADSVLITPATGKVAKEVMIVGGMEEIKN